MPLEWNDLDLQENYVEQLFKVVDRDRANALVWYLRDLEIVGTSLRGLPVPDLESQVDESPHGFRITWEELVQLMGDAADIHDLVATAHTTEVTVDLPSLEASGYSGCAVVIEIFDSGTYKVGGVTMKASRAMRQTWTIASTNYLDGKHDKRLDRRQEHTH